MKSCTTPLNAAEGYEPSCSDATLGSLVIDATLGPIWQFISARSVCALLAPHDDDDGQLRGVGMLSRPTSRRSECSCVR